MKYLSMIWIVLSLVACGGANTKTTIQPEWIEVSTTCPNGFSQYSDQARVIINQCINSQDARSIDSLVLLESYIWDCLYDIDNRNPDFSFSSSSEMVINISNGIVSCSNSYKR
jgi:hypothetical protein